MDLGEYDNKSFRYVLTAPSIPCEAYPGYANHINLGAERMICAITQQAWAMMIDSHLPVQCWDEAVNTTDYLQHRSRNKGPLWWENGSHDYKARY